MKRTFLLLICLVAPLISRAQAGISQTYHHSWELSTGFPCLLSVMYPPGTGNSAIEAEKEGQKLATVFFPNLSFSYQYRFSRRWEVGARINVHGFIYTRSQYPQNPSGSYDWKANPEKTVAYESRGIVPSVFARFIWLPREKIQMYSSLGVGFYVNKGTSLSRVAPDFIPIGLHFGKDHFYGIAELSIGSAGTGLLMGLGYRL